MANTQETFGFILQDVARLARRDFNTRVKELGLTQSQWQVLVYIASMAAPRQSQIAEILEMKPISVARTIDRMEASGWVERRPDPKDRRAVNLYLTPKIAPVLADIRAHALETRALALSGLSESDQENFTRILQQLRKNLKNEAA